MTKTETKWEPMGLERFAHLEDKIYRVAEAFKAIRKENEVLRAENQKVKAELDTLKESQSTLDEDLANLQKEREELRERVEKALNLLAALEVR